MEIGTGALSSVIIKLGDLLIGEYSLQKGVKGEIRFLQAELESMKGALEKVSTMPHDQLDIQNKIWARDLRELSYDIEDSIDTFMVRGNGHEPAKLRGLRKFVDISVGLFRKAKIRHGIASEIRDIKSRVIEVHKRRNRYKVNHAIDKATTTTMVDPRLFVQDTEEKELVGMDETTNELIKVLMDRNGMPLHQGTILSIFGFGGLGKTTLAKAVYEKIKTQFDCCAFVYVSQTPDLKELFKELLSNLDKNINAETFHEGRLIDVVKEFLKTRRYLIVLDDIWDISVWKVIKRALPDNDGGYIVVTTTRNADVAEQSGCAYKMKPLSENNSRKLLYKRVFRNDTVEGTERCPDKELAEVSDRILEKCAGVPLAIIMMASLLACKGRNKMDWYEVYYSIGTGLEDNLDVENMRRILSFSYYNMPSHLKTCLLYLSMFPEDYKFEKHTLIWMWIAEGFIQCEKQGKSLFELGETYFNELISRSMIEPVYRPIDLLYGCRVHDMVLDLICSLSIEANFVTIFDYMDRMAPSSKIRRLSIQYDMEDNSMTLAHVRSVVALELTTSLVPVLRSFQVLRVMDLQHCDLSQGYNFNKCLGNLFHLRYLRLRYTSIVELPEEIGNLQFLQILDVRDNNIACLPSNVVQLKHLMCLKMDLTSTMPNGIGRLGSLEELSDLCLRDSNLDMIQEELGQLTELRVLSICSRWNGKLVEFLSKLEKIQDLNIGGTCYPRKIDGLDAWVAPRYLRRLEIGSCWFSTLPCWMNPSHVPYLSKLSIAVWKLQQADLDMLGKLPALSFLDLRVAHANLRFVVGPGSFPSLITCWFKEFVSPVVFQKGAMPRVRTVCYDFSVRGAFEISSSHGVGLVLGLGLLPSLQKIEFWLKSEWTGKARELMAMLLHASKIHPNHPSLTINGLSADKGAACQILSV